MNKPLAENKYGHGARAIHPIHRALVKSTRPALGKASIFDWTKGYDVRDTIGPISIKDQGSSSSCSGQAGSYFLEIQRRLQKINEGALSAKSIYAPIAYVGGGTTVVALTTQIASVGANLEHKVPSYYVTGEPLSEAMMIEKSWETDQTNLDALLRAGYTPYDIGEGIDEVACAVRDWGGVIMEIQGQNGKVPGWLSSTPTPPTPLTWWQKTTSNHSDIWTHFMVVVGARMVNEKKMVIALNSWGTSVGDNGSQYFGEDYFNSGFILDCFTFIYDTHVSPLANNTSIWSAIALWFKAQSWFSTA